MILTRTLRTLILPAITIVTGFLAVFWLSGFIERNHPQLPEGFEDSDLAFNGSRLKGFACGLEGLIADWYWMRSLQYIGDKIVKSNDEFTNIDDLTSLNPRLLYPYLENATDLDPHFIAAYSYGAIVMPAIDPEKAIAIAEKGIAKNADEWRLYQQLGYIYWKLGRFDQAAEAYEKGSAIAGAQPFMKMMAASMRTEGGSRATARQIFGQMLDGSDDPMVRLTATRRLKELDSLDEREVIDKALAEFREKNGRCANGFGEILPMLMQVRLPETREFRVDNANRLVDPTDAPYLLDKENCRSKIDPARTELPLK